MAKNYQTIDSCIVCQGSKISNLFKVGETCLTGYFPLKDEDDPIRTPITLNICQDCGNLQMREKVNPELMFRDYWYRSSTTNSMKAHLDKIAQKFAISGGHHLDIGCNDGFLMGSMTRLGMSSWGIDPSSAAIEAAANFPGKISNDFFSFEAIRKDFKNAKLKFDVITAISMFYDVPMPVDFLKNIKSILTEAGIAIIEVNYAKTFLEKQNIDMLGQEHLVYYFIKTFMIVAERAGLLVNDAYLTEMNGGNITFLLSANQPKKTQRLENLITDEREYLRNFEQTDFQQKINESFSKFRTHLELIAKESVIKILGASTRGAFIAQYLDLDSRIIASAVDLQENKRGRRMPGTDIIIEYDLEAVRPDIYLVMPYQFKSEIIERYHEYLKNGGELYFYRPIYSRVYYCPSTHEILEREIIN